MDSPFRLHSISLLIFGKYARFIRWDRSSAIVTQKFDYTEDPALLVDFLRRFSYAEPVDLGVDPTVKPASREETSLCHQLLGVDHPIYKIEIPSREDHERAKSYLIPAERRKISSPFGRGSRSTKAVRLHDKKVVFVKDYWRVVADGLLCEGEIYRRLEDAKVPHIAPFDRGGDIAGHETVGHKYASESWSCRTGGISTYQHYRMSLGVVARDLFSFQSSREYTRAICHAVEG
jgi:hypothetical protein